MANANQGQEAVAPITYFKISYESTLHIVDGKGDSNAFLDNCIMEI